MGTLPGGFLGLRALVVMIALFFLSIEAHARGFWEVKILRQKDHPLETLRFNAEEIELEDLEIDKQVVPLLRVPGEFTEPGASLLFDNVPLVTSERNSNRFVLTVPLSGLRTPISLTVILFDGKSQQERVEFSFAEYSNYMAVQNERRKSGLGLSPSLGFTAISYSEAGVAPYSAVMLSGKIGFQFPIAPPAWDGAFNLFGNLLPLIADSSGRVARFTGVNFRLGYAVRSIKDPWKLSFMGGFYMNQMQVTDDAFGFQSVSGPQFFPLVRRKLSDGRSVYGYLKLAPVAAGGRVKSLADREIALGLGGGWSTKAGTPLSLSLDLADLAVTILGVPVSCRTATLSLGTFL